MRPDIENDLLYADNIEEVFVVFPGTSDQYRVPHAIRTQVSVREAAASGGVYTQHDVRFSLLTSEFEIEALPEVGGLLVARGTELWGIYGRDEEVGQLRLWCKRELIGTLARSVKVQRPVRTRDSDLVQQTAWEDFRLGVPASIQIVNSELVVEHLSRRIKISHRIVCDLPDALVEPGFRFVDEGRRSYNVVRVTGQGVIGTLAVFDCEAARLPQAL